MNFLSLVGVEFKKIKRSKILLILLVATVILWIPSIVNAKMNFDMQAEGISSENNFFIQGFMGMSWFMFPASMVVGTVLLSQTERANKGILKMLSLPISTAKLCMAKFIVLLRATWNHRIPECSILSAPDVHRSARQYRYY